MTKKIAILLVCTLSLSLNITAQKVVKLWDGKSPESNGISEPELIERDGARASKVSEAELYIYLPEKIKKTQRWQLLYVPVEDIVD